MRLRPRSESPSSDAAARVLGLLGPPSEGWVPPPADAAPREEADGEESPPPAVPPPAVPPPAVPPPAVPPPDVPPPDVPPPAVPPPAVRPRLDPGRRGAAALLVAALVAAVVAGGVVLRGRPQEVVVPDVTATGAPLPGAPAAPTAPPSEVVVAVAGEVVRPGLVRLPAGSRVDDAVRAAGGVRAGTDPGLLNLARRLVDGEQVLVGVEPPPGTAPVADVGAAGPVDLNTATVADLDALPGIGPVLAQRIVDWRTEHGRFASVEQLREVTGIGESKYADLAAEVAVP